MIYLTTTVSPAWRPAGIGDDDHVRREAACDDDAIAEQQAQYDRCATSTLEVPMVKTVDLGSADLERRKGDRERACRRFGRA